MWPEGGRIERLYARTERDNAISAGLEMLRLRHVIDETDGLLRVPECERRLVAYYANSIAHLVSPAS